MNVTTIVMLSVIFNLSFSVVCNAGIAPVTGGLPTPTLGINYPHVTWPTLASIAKASGCTTNSTSWTCNNSIQVIEQFWATALTFGVFLWGVINVLPQIAMTILVPTQMMSFFGVPQTIINIYAAGFAILYLYFAYCLFTGRYNATVE